MKVTVHKSSVKGKINVPSSKSMTIRAMMCGALSKGTSEILHPLVSEDTNAAATVLGQVGVAIKKGPDLWRVPGGKLQASPRNLFCGESAATLRFMTAICALIPGRHRLIGGPSLSQRPVKPLVDALQNLGIKAAVEGKDTPPVTIEGGPITVDSTELPGDISSQFVSALLLLAPFAPRGMAIRLTTPLTSKPYVEMTISCLREFGIHVDASPDRFFIRRQLYRPARYEVEGDWSSASYFLALGAACGEVEVSNLRADSLQGDRVILDYLRKMGANVWVAKDSSVNVSRLELKAIPAYLADSIDLLPTMAVLAALAQGKSELSGIAAARLKESDRVTAVKNNLQKMGVDVVETEDTMVITGPVETPKETVVLDSYGDHRIAMAFGVLGAAIGGVTIKGAECVAKTYPTFWDMLRRLGVRTETHAE
jgi:3-phosphoshikimate 1-carboxyvinyltransferase